MQRAYDVSCSEAHPHDEGLKAALRYANTVQMLMNMPQWDINYRANMRREGKTCISQLYDKYEGPVIICGAGPSISKLPSLMKKTGYSTPVICVDASYERLRQWGFTPNFMVSRDSSPTVFDMIRNIGSDTLALLSLYIDLTVGNHCEARTEVYWFGPISPWSTHVQCLHSDYGKEYENIVEGPIVGFLAADIALQLGFTEVILIGNDLGWNNIEDARKSCEDKDIMEIEGLTDRTHYSRMAYVKAVTAFASLIDLYPDAKFKDASGGLLSKIYEKVEV